jgi:hypothetical protein
LVKFSSVVDSSRYIDLVISNDQSIVSLLTQWIMGLYCIQNKFWWIGWFLHIDRLKYPCDVTQLRLVSNCIIKYSRVKNIVQISLTVCGCEWYGNWKSFWTWLRHSSSWTYSFNVFNELCRSGYKKYHRHQAVLILSILLV